MNWEKTELSCGSFREKSRISKEAGESDFRRKLNRGGVLQAKWRKSIKEEGGINQVKGCSVQVKVRTEYGH